MAEGREGGPKSANLVLDSVLQGALDGFGGALEAGVKGGVDSLANAAMGLLFFI